MWKVYSSQRVERYVECVWVNLTRTSPESGTSSDPSIMLLQLKSSHIKYSSFVRGPTVILPIVRIECDALESNKSRGEDNAMDCAELNMVTPILGSVPCVLSLALTVYPSRKTTSDARSVWTYVTLLYMCVLDAVLASNGSKPYSNIPHRGVGETSNVVLGRCCIAANGAVHQTSTEKHRNKVSGWSCGTLWCGCICSPVAFRNFTGHPIVPSALFLLVDVYGATGESKMATQSSSWKDMPGHFAPTVGRTSIITGLGLFRLIATALSPEPLVELYPDPRHLKTSHSAGHRCRYLNRKRHMFLGLDASFRLDAVVVRVGRFAHACSQLLKQWGFSKRVAPKPYPTGLRSADELQLQGQKVTLNDRKLRFWSVPLLPGQCIDSVPAGRLSRLPTARVTKDVLLCHYGSQSLRFILRRICGLSVKNVWLDL